MEYRRIQPDRDVMNITNFAELLKEMGLESDDKLQIYFCYLCEATQASDSKHTITKDEFTLGFLKIK